MAFHYVSLSGSGTWGNSTNIATPCSLATANANVAGGDTVYLRGGTYTLAGTDAIIPAHSGSAGNWITYSSYGAESPVFVNSSSGADCYAIGLNNLSYISIKGIAAINFGRWLFIRNYSHHIEISYCDLHSTTGQNVNMGMFAGEYTYDGSKWIGYVHDIWLHHCSLYNSHDNDGGNPTGNLEGNDLIRLGLDQYGAGLLANHHITLEDNHIYHGGHACMDEFAEYLVVNRNRFHNEPWIIDYNGVGVHSSYGWLSVYDTGYEAYNGHYGHRAVQICREAEDPIAHALVEGNRFSWGSLNPGNSGADGLDMSGAREIVRFNDVFANMNHGIMAKYSWSNDCTVFNNTIYHNGWGYTNKFATSTYPPVYSCDGVCPEDMAGFTFVYNGNAAGQNANYALKNNILYDNYSAYFHPTESYNANPAVNGLDITQREGKAVTLDHGPIVNNWQTVDGDPKFVDTYVMDPSSATRPDLSLLVTSPCIGAGGALTVSVGTGTNSTALTVDNPLYFQDGTWGAEMTHGVTLFPDWIAIGTVGNVVQISAVNYDTKVITLASPMSWSNGASIWLYKKSDGVRVLYGSSPDLGAHPYFGTAPLTKGESVNLIVEADPTFYLIAQKAKQRATNAVDQYVTYVVTAHAYPGFVDNYGIGVTSLSGTPVGSEVNYDPKTGAGLEEPLTITVSTDGVAAGKYNLLLSMAEGEP